MRDRKLNRLFERFRSKGDISALGDVFDLTATELLRVALSLVRSPAEADDLLQATFLTAIERADSFDKGRNLVPWLLGILVNHAHQARRANRENQGLETAAGVSASGADPAGAVEALELSQFLREAMESVPRPYREVLEAFLTEGKRAVDIAQETGEAPGTVRMRIHRGLDLLRKAMPASAALGAGVIAVGGRGLASARSEVMREAATAQWVTAAGAATTQSFLGGVTLSTKIAMGVLVVCVLAVVGALFQGLVGSGAGSIRSSQAAIAKAPGTDEVKSDLAAVTQEAGPDRASAYRSGPAAEGPASSFAGRILEHDGEPLAGAAVELFQIRTGHLARSLEDCLTGGIRLEDVVVGHARTDEGGRFHLGGARTQAFHLLGIDLGGQRSSVRVVELSSRRGESTPIGDILLEPSHRISGRLIDASGHPVADARVRAAQVPENFLDLHLETLRADSRFWIAAANMIPDVPDWVSALSERLPFPSATSDADGVFDLVAVPEGETTLFVDKRGVGSTALSLGLVDSEADLGDTTLPYGLPVGGRVVDARGEAVSGAEVLVGRGRLAGEEASLFGLMSQGRSSPIVVLQPAGLSGSDGSFAIEGLPVEGETLVAVRRGEGAAWTYQISESRQGVVVELPEPHKLDVVARDAAGALLDGVTLEVVTLESTILGPALPITGLRALDVEVGRIGEGRYELRGLQPGMYSVMGSAPGFGMATAQAMIGETSAPIEMRFMPRHDLVVTVLDEVSGQPLVGAEVTAHATQVIGPGESRGVTDEAGRASLGLTQREGGQGYIVRADHPDYAAASAVLESPEVGALQLSLNGGGDIRVQVLDGLDPGEASYQVTLDPRDASFPDDAALLFSRTDDQGVAHFGGVPALNYTVRVMPRILGGDPMPMIFAQAKTTALARGEVKAEAGEVAEVSIRVATPEPEAAVVRGWITSHGVPWKRLIVTLHQPGNRRLYDVTDANGAFRFDDVQAGSCALEITRQVALPAELVGVDVWDQILLIEAGELRDLHFDWELIEQEIMVLDAAGRPTAGAWIEASSIMAGSGEWADVLTQGVTDGEGRATLYLFSSGAFHAEIRSDDSGSTEVTFAVQGQAPDPVTVTLRAGVPCEGSVSLLREPPRPGAWWLIFSKDERELATVDVAMTTTGGRFKVTGLQPGTYTAHLVGNGESYGFARFDLGAGGDRDVRLEFARED